MIFHEICTYIVCYNVRHFSIFKTKIPYLFLYFNCVLCRLAIPAIALCFGLTTLFGSGLVFAAGVFYGLMGLGKKYTFIL